MVDEIKHKEPTGRIEFGRFGSVSWKKEEHYTFSSMNFNFTVQQVHIQPGTTALFPSKDCFSGYLNLLFEGAKKSAIAHGLIGQTLHHNHSTDPAVTRISPEGVGEIQGTYFDYEVTGPWGTDFRFNLYRDKN